MRLFRREQEFEVFSPVKGSAIPLSEVNDGVFSEELLGKGCAIRPESETVTSPVNGKVEMVFPTGHAVGVKSDDGVEVLIHIGLETVNMNGDGFETHVKQGDSVKAGDPLVTFSKEKIEKAGYDPVTMVIISNTKDFKEVKLLKLGSIETKEALLQIVK